MNLVVPLGDGLTLAIADRHDEAVAHRHDEATTDRGHGAPRYPTGSLQRGLLLFDHGLGLAEEGVGFGVPILKRGIETVFPGSVELSCERSGTRLRLTAAFEMDLVERLARPGAGSVSSRSLYAVKNSLAALHRRSPALRGALTATSNAVRRSFGWVTTYERVTSAGTLPLTYTVSEGEGDVAVTLDLCDLRRDVVTEVVVMNEQGARHFDRYVDESGVSLRGAEIGTWDEVGAARASFVSVAHRVAFSLGQAEGARLHRGRELIGGRVAWSGFGYSVSPALSTFRYELEVARVP